MKKCVFRFLALHVVLDTCVSVLSLSLVRELNLTDPFASPY